jgi:uncharacterized protein (TIGR02145 family)
MLLMALSLLSLSIFAQAPTGFNFQGVALTASGTPVLTKKISLRLSLLEGSATGTLRYQELHGVNTDAYGQFTVVVGSGQPVTGKFSDLQWSKVAYFLKSEIDVDGATNFVNVGTSQLMSVPYALYATTSGAASVNVDSILNELKSIKLVQKGDSIILNNNRGAVYIQKIDSLSKLTSELAKLKAQYDGTTDSILNILNKKYDSLAKTISNFNSSPTIPSTSNTASTMKFVSKGLDSELMPSVYFDGEKTHVQIGATKLGSLISAKNFTIEAWVKSLQRSDTRQTIFTSGFDGSGWVDYQVSLLGGRIILQTRNSSGLVISADFPNDSLWHHVAFTNIENKSSAIFIDGVEKIRQNNIGLGIVNSPNVTIGALFSPINNYKFETFFKGNLRKLRVSKGVVYTTEFNPSYKYQTTDSTLAFWELNEGSGTTINCSNPDYNGILYNGAWQSNDANTNNTVTDIDGNVYKTVKIGEQIWMAENLKTTKYRDGSKIQNVTDLNVWNTLSTGAYCFWNNDATKKDLYGALYNYYTIVNTQKLCPTNWHVPSINEFKALENYLGVDSAAKQLKTTAGWSGTNYNGTNRSGFSAFPSGLRITDGNFQLIGGAYYWTSSEFNSSSSQYIEIYFDINGELNKRVLPKVNGMSIRCIKD